MTSENVPYKLTPEQAAEASGAAARGAHPLVREGAAAQMSVLVSVAR